MTRLQSSAATLALFALLALSACHGPEIAKLELGEIGATATKEVTVQPGQEIEFGITPGAYEYDGNDNVFLDVSLLENDANVAQASWLVLRLGGGFGQQFREIKRYNSDWKLTVPPQGATAIRATTRFETGTTKAKFGNFAVLVHAK